MEKILITGTGRSGTTFLIKIFSFLDFDTGYNRDNYKKSIKSNCNAGMERHFSEKYYILKNPHFIAQMQQIIKDPLIKIKSVIIPIRDLKLSAISRTKLGYKDGGFWNATDEQSQIKFYEKILINYIFTMAKYNINTIFIDFDKMISDKVYLFNKLKYILDEKNISYELFSDVYDEAASTSKKLK